MNPIGCAYMERDMSKTASNQYFAEMIFRNRTDAYQKNNANEKDRVVQAIPLIAFSKIIGMLNNVGTIAIILFVNFEEIINTLIANEIIDISKNNLTDREGLTT